MVYTIGFGMRNNPDVLSVIERNTAKEALELAEALERREEEIRFIDTPHEHAPCFGQRRSIADAAISRATRSARQIPDQAAGVLGSSFLSRRARATR
jgi:hypothetical protein